MAKQIALLRKKPGMSRGSFIARYENGHAPLIARLLPLFDGYRRSYIIPGSMSVPAHVGNKPMAPPFDVVTELWFGSEQAVEALKDRVGTSDVGAQIAEDEEALFDRSRMLMFGVDECRTPEPRLRPRPEGHSGPPAITMLCFLDRRPQMTRAEFINYYETQHSQLALRLLVRDDAPLFARYVRNYPRTDDQFSVGNGSIPPPIGFDVMTEIGFWTAADFNMFQEQCAQSDIGSALSADEANLFDRDTVRVLLVDTYTSRITELPQA